LLRQLDNPALAEPRLLRFQTGHRARAWVHNVVALGLSSGFIEPLESTSIFLVQRGMGRLIDLLLAGAPLTEAVLANFNGAMARQFTRVRDFIILHYCLSARRDSALWRAMASMELPETLAFKIHAWRQSGTLHQYDEEGFDQTSWLAIYAGMGHWPERADPTLGDVERAVALRGLRWRRERIAEAVAAMPAHGAYLRGRLGR
jgi:tryptophan halogenase